MIRKLRTLSLAGLLAASLGAPHAMAQTATTSTLDAIVQQNAAQTYRDFLTFVSLPSDAIVPADIVKNVAWLKPAFEKAGFAAQAVQSGERPLLFAEYPKQAGLKTILFYLHFDAQPVIPEKWHQPDPWVPVLKERGADGAWKQIPMERLFAAGVNPDWRLFARAIADDKGPIMMLLAAMGAMHQAGVAPAFNVKVILDSEEEKNSPGLPAVIDANRALLAADSLVVVDGPMHPSNRPTVIYGNRGLAAVSMTVYGAKRALHSGHYGNYAPNPAQELAQLLASMKDDRGRVTIPGYYDGIKFDDAARSIMKAVPDDEKALNKEFGIARPDAVGNNLQEALQYPSLNVRGMKSGEIGAKVATIIPDTATAEIDIRTVPEVDPNRLVALVRGWIEKQGYYITAKEPTDAERAEHGKIVSFTGHVGEDAIAARTDLGAPIGTWATTAIKGRFQVDPVRIRIMGGTVPTASMARKLNMPFVIVPMANYDDNQHTHDENLRIGNFEAGVKTFLAMFAQPFN